MRHPSRPTPSPARLLESRIDGHSTIDIARTNGVSTAHVRRLVRTELDRLGYRGVGELDALVQLRSAALDAMWEQRHPGEPMPEVQP